MKNSLLYKVAIEGFLLGACVLLLFACISFSIWDAPSLYTYPHNIPAANWCGSIGAFSAYYLFYYVGPGMFLVLVAAIWILLTSLSGTTITQPVLRSIGLALLVTAASASWNLLWQFKPIWPYTAGGFPQGNGGVLGISVAHFLSTRFALLGTTIILGSTWLVGAVLLADSVVLAILRWFGRGISRAMGFAVPAWATARRQSASSMNSIWKRLGARERERRLATVQMEEEPDINLESVFHRERRSFTIHQEPVTEQVIESPEVQPAAETKEASPESVPAEPVARPVQTIQQKVKARAAQEKKTKPHAPETYDDYILPPLDLLAEPQFGFAAVQEKMVESKAHTLEDLLAEFGINAHVINAEPGPAITMYELELAPGIKVSQISNLANDMARALGAGSVRVVAPLPGRHTIGIEVPNSQREIVRIKDLIQKAGPKSTKMYIPLFLGKDSAGEVLTSDLASMPHLLIAGTTGSGKSVCINSIITSILMTRRPDEVKLVLIDPKMVEMSMFESLPHLMCPVVTETKRAEQILEWATTKMDERYELLAEAKVRNIASYNRLTMQEILERFNPSTPEEEAKIPKRLPHIVIVIDELADLMMTAAKEIEAFIVRIAQKSRAVGIHLIVATQRPQATVVTGLIKSNMPCRIGFRVAARMDSRIILDQNGAETLLGQGDMLFLKPGTSDLVRAQGAYLDDEEIGRIVKHLKEVAEPQYHPELMQLNRIDMDLMKADDLYDEAVKVVLETKRGSVSLLQRRLSIGYARASRIIEMMAATGLLGEYKGSQAREVTMTLEEYEQMKREMLEEQVNGYEDLTRGQGQEQEEYDEPVEVVDEDSEKTDKDAEYEYAQEEDE
ncbi:MAG: DNA translocase FtsK [Sedimentisphaerales bacterium]|nr:DNA translocase FtsK [Sedimentisphaerales bacterium]